MTRWTTRLSLGAAALVAGTGMLILTLAASPAGATGPGGPQQTTQPSFTTCDNLKGWYANADEQNDLPEATSGGLKFEGKDLIHHATSPIDLADMDKVSGTFHASVAGKVVFKVETSNPYSSIITQADGKLWSTAMTADQDGGQNHPVAKYSDLVGKPTKPGKAAYTSASAVVTFGVGYWTETGSTVVDWISFHGTKYDLTCHHPRPCPPTATPTKTSGSPTASPTKSTTGSPTGSPTKGTSSPAGSPTGTVTTSPSSGGVIIGGPTPTQPGGSLALTGFPVGPVVGLGAALTIGGAVILAFLYVRRRRDNVGTEFIA